MVSRARARTIRNGSPAASASSRCRAWKAPLRR